MKVKESAAITGSMTRTSKMPGLSYSLPAWECKTGSKLRKIKNSVCSMCYALKGNYTRYKAIKAAQYVRLRSLQDARWTAAMVTQVKPTPAAMVAMETTLVLRVIAPRSRHSMICGP